MFKKFTLTLALVMAFCLNASAAKVSYSASFTASAPADWVALDNNADGVTWAVNWMNVMSVDGGDVDDYYVSPAFELEAGVTYSISTSSTAYWGYGGDVLTLEVGTSTTDATSFSVVKQLTPTDTEDDATVAEAEIFEYTPTTSGTYHFAFHLVKANEAVFSYNIVGFSIEGGEDSGETVEPGEGEEGGETETPELAEGQFVVTENFDDDTHFTASATVPDGWASAGSFPFGRAIAMDYGMLANSGSYVIASLRQQYDTSVDEVIYTPLKKLVAGKECTLSFYIYAPGGSQAATFYHTVTVKAGTAQTADAQTIEVGAIAAAVSAWTKYEYTFTPEADGEYCFSLAIARSTALNFNHGLLLFDDFTITGYSPAEEETPAVETVALPYSIDFSAKTDGVAAWTAIDLSEEPYYTWAYDQYGYYHSSNPSPGYLGAMGLSVRSEVQNDYCVSPAFALEAGKKYKVTTKTSNFNTDFASTWTLELGTDPADAATFTSAGSLSPQLERVGVNDLPSQELTIEVAESGVYYLAVHASTNDIKSNSSNSLFLHYFAVEEKAEEETPEEPEGPEVASAALPYSIDFTVAANTEWTTIDNNGSLTWAYVSDAYNMSTPAVSISAGFGVSETSDDYYVSPQFTLEAGKTYVVKTRVADGYGLSGGTFNLQIGTSATDASTYSVVSALSPYYSWDYDNSSYVPEATYEISVSETGTYHLAYYQSVTANVGWLYQLIDFSIAEKEEGEVVIPDVETAAIPYSIDFTTSQEGWTSIDNSDYASKTWAAGTGTQMGGSYPTVTVAQDYNSNTNDYFVSPAFNLVAGSKYKVSFKAFDPVWSGAHAELSLEYGQSATDMSAYTAIASNIAVDNMTYDYTGNGVSKLPVLEYELEVAETGVYHLALHVVSGMGVVNTELFSFAIEEIVDPLYVIGSCQGWNPSNGLEMTYADGVYTLENVEFADGGNFGLTTVKSSDWNTVNASRYGFETDNAVVAENEAVEIIKGEGAIQIPIAGVYTIVADLKAMTVTVTCTDVAYDNIYVLGNYKESSWNPSYGVELTKVEEGVFSGEVELYEVHEGETGTGKAYFNIATTLGTDWTAVNATVRFGAEESNKVIASGETQTLVPNTSGNPNSWAVDAKDECLVNMTVNLKKRTIAINSITGIENVGVDADDSEAVYYNLQGIEVVNPAKGNIYIVKRGNRVTKELK